MNPLNWTDQPKKLEDARILARFHVSKGPLIEIRKGFDCWYFTSGNLFGSQTVQADDVESIFKLVMVANSGLTEQDLPPGCKVMD